MDGAFLAKHQPSVLADRVNVLTLAGDQNNVDIRPQIFQNVLGRCYIELDVLKAFVPPEPFRPVTQYISLQFTIPACARDKWILGASNALALGEPVCGFFPRPYSITSESKI